MRYGRVRKNGYRVHQRCCQALSFPGSLVCVRKRKAHSGALWENTKRTRVRCGRVTNKGYRVHQRCCQALSFPASLVCVRKRKAHPGALWEGEKQRLSGSSVLLPSFGFSWFLGLCKKTQSNPGALYGRVRNKGYRVHQRCCQALSFPASLVCVRKRKAHPGALWRVRNKGYRVHQRCCQALGFPGSLVCVRKRKAHPGALWENTKRTRALWEGEKQKLSGSSALLPSFELFWFLGL